MPASTDKLHDHAVQAEKHAEALATGLAQVGADEAAVKTVTQCAEILRKIATALAKGGTSDDQPEPEAQQPRTMDEAVDQHFAERNAARG